MHVGPRLGTWSPVVLVQQPERKIDQGERGRIQRTAVKMGVGQHTVVKLECIHLTGKNGTVAEARPVTKTAERTCVQRRAKMSDGKSSRFEHVGLSMNARLASAAREGGIPLSGTRPWAFGNTREAGTPRSSISISYG